jgi:hypothetical protein
MDRDDIDLETAEATLGVVLKAKEDVDAVSGSTLAGLVDRAKNAGAAQ